MRVALLGGVVGPVLFSLTIVVAAALRPGYSHSEHFISELGASETPFASLMNYAGFVPAGTMLLCFSVALAKYLPSTRSAVLATVLVSMFGLGIAVSGLISCDAGCPTEGSSENRIHNTIAPVSFIALICASAILGLSFRRTASWHDLWLYSFATSVAGFVLLVLLVSSLETRRLTGLWQRLLLLDLFGWCSVVGTRAFKLASRPTNAVLA